MAEITDYLNGLGEQNVPSEKEIFVVKNPKVAHLLNVVKYIAWNSFPSVFECYNSCLPQVQIIKHSSVDVREFSIELKRYEKLIDRSPGILGIFISALVNSCEEESLEVVTEHLNKKLNFLGFKNKKNLTIKGSTGYYAGKDMESGVLTIKGDTGNVCGEMILSGEIHVEGSAGNYVGRWSEGGEIHVKGKLGSIGDDCKSKIYHKGVQIWPR